MRVVVQRITNAKLCVASETVSEIGKGLLVVLGIKTDDTLIKADTLTQKISKLRIFKDENGKINLSVKDVGGEVLVVSNFTLYGNALAANRPDFSHSAKSEVAKPIYDYFCEKMNLLIPTKTGRFGENMQIDVHLDGPITIQIEV